MGYLWLFIILLFLPFILMAQEPKLIVSKGHDGKISAVFTPDNKQLLSFGEDLNPTIWDVASAKVIGYLNYNKFITQAFFLNDKSTLITVSSGGEIVYWNWPLKKIIYSLTGAGVLAENCIAVCSENKTVLSIFSPDGKVTSLNLLSRKIIGTINAFQKTKRFIGMLVIDKNGKFFAASSYPLYKVNVFNIQTGKLVKTISTGYEMPVSFLFIGTNSLLVVSDSTKIYDYQQPTHDAFIDFGAGNKILQYKDSILISGSMANRGRKVLYQGLELINYKVAKPIAVPILNEGEKTVDFSLMANNQLALVSENGLIELYNLAKNEVVGSFANESVGDKKCIVTSLNKQIAAVLNVDIFGRFSMLFIDSKNQNIISSFKKSASIITDVFLSPRGDSIIFNEERSVSLWNTGNITIQNLVNTESLLGDSKTTIEKRYYTSGTRPDKYVTQVDHIYTHWRNDLLFTATDFSIDTISVWNIKNIVGKKQILPETGKKILYWRPNEQSNQLFISFEDSSFCILSDYAEAKNFKYINTGKPITGAKFLPDSKLIFLVTEDTLILYDIAKDQQIRKIHFSTKEDDNFILNYSCTWMLRNNGIVTDIENNVDLFQLPDLYKESRRAFSSNDSLIAYESTKETVNIFDVALKKVIHRFPLPSGKIKGLSFSRNTKRLAVSLSNRTTKIFDIQNKTELASFVLFDESDYILQVPSGYYMASPGASKLLHYVKANRVISFEQLDVKYNRPDKVLEAIGSTDTALIRSYRKAYEKRIKKLGIDITAFRDGYSVPEADFANRDKIELEQKDGKLKLDIKSIDSTYKLDRFNIWVNESPVYGQRGISLRNKHKNNFDSTISINLSEGENRIETSITNMNGTESYRMPLQVNYTPAVKQTEKTYFIGIGIDQFAQSKYNLKYSTKDIRDLSEKLKEKYNDIIIDTLFNENVTISNVKALKQKLLNTTVNDKVIISYSGHGMLTKDFDYYLSTYAVNFDKPEENGLAYDELENLLDSIPARKKLMLIDACHSGEVDKDDLIALNASSDKLIKGLKPVAYKKDGQLGLKNSFELMQSLFVNVGKSTGATIISAAAGTEFALEGVDNLPNGVFTYCILEAMNKYPTMKISELKKTVGERVVEITKGLQKPTSRNETIAVDWEVW